MIKKLVVLVLVLTATAGPAPARQDDATATTRLFLHIWRPAVADPQTPPKTYLSVVDARDPGNRSGYADSGIKNEVALATGGPAFATTFTTIDGVPLKLDVARPVTGLVAVGTLAVGAGSATVYAGAGAATMELELVGETASGRRVVLGTQSIDYLVTPAEDTYELDVSMELPEAAAGKRFTSLELSALGRGAAVFSHQFELDDPASYIDVPTG